VKDYLSFWHEGSKEISGSSLEFPISVTGEFNRYLVYAVQSVRIEMRVEPAPALEVIVPADLADDLRRYEYLDYAVFGLLDVLTVSGKLSVNKMRVVFGAVEYDQIENSPMAFRLAGRDAGQKILEQFNKRCEGQPQILRVRSG